MKTVRLILALQLAVVLFFASSCTKNNDDNGGGNTSLGNVTVTTLTPTDITSAGATCGAEVNAEADAMLMEMGVCWSTTAYPTINDSYLSTKNCSTTFVCTLENLTPETKYHVRAYALNDTKYFYGEDKDFTTLADGGGSGGGEGLVFVSTNDVVEITSSTAMCGGCVSVTGDVAIIARGVCWSYSPLPTIAQNHTLDGQGAGSFTSSISGLEAGATYYVRAYAQTNSDDVVYGDEKSFSTVEIIQPASVTVTLINVTPTSLELKFEPSDNTSYYCFNTGGTMTSTTHQTGVKTQVFKKYQHDYFQPNTEYEFSVVAYDANGIAGEVVHPRYTTSPAPYANYLKIEDWFFPLYTATIRNSVALNPEYGYKEILLSGDTGCWVLLSYQCYYYELNNVWYSGTYPITEHGFHQYQCQYNFGTNSIIDVNGGTFTITKSGSITTYDLIDNDGSGRGYVTAHFSGY